MSGLFIAVEGPNGVGKSTVAGLLATALSERTGQPVHHTTEPTYTPLGRLLRASEYELQGRPLALALAADRNAHVETDIIPALDSGCHVITDRYVQSSLVLQRLDGLDLTEIWRYNQYVLQATSIYLEDTPETIAARLAARHTLSRLELTGNPQRELTLYRQAANFLRRHDWDQHFVDCRGKTPEQVVGDIIALLAC